MLLQVTSEQFLEVEWPFIQQTMGGTYTITISGARTRLMYELKVCGSWAQARVGALGVRGALYLMSKPVAHALHT
jgi:hypothetical protein